MRYAQIATIIVGPDSTQIPTSAGMACSGAAWGTPRGIAVAAHNTIDM